MIEGITVPGSFTRGMSKEDKEYFEESYRNSGFILRAICKELDKKIHHLVIESEGMTDMHEIAVNHGQRKALRALTSLLIKPIEVNDA